MATKKKSKKAKKTKKTKSPVKKKKAAAKKVKAKKKKSAPRKAAKKARSKATPKKKKPTTPMAAPISAIPAGEERIGIVTHYFNHLSVAIIQLETSGLRTGDKVHVKGHTSDFYQVIESMEVDHVHVDAVQPGASFGLRVKDHAREHDIVYIVTKP